MKEDRERAEEVAEVINQEFRASFPHLLRQNEVNVIRNALMAVRAERDEKLVARIRDLDKSESQLIGERDYFENKITEINVALGRDDEWSNACDVGDECIKAAEELVGRDEKLVAAARDTIEALNEAADHIERNAGYEPMPLEARIYATQIRTRGDTLAALVEAKK